MPSPSVSLAVPVFEPDPDHLARLLESIRAQGREALDVVLRVDRGGPEVEAAAAAAGLGSIEVVRNPEPLGMVANWNAAAALATGDLMMVLGQDDELGRGMLERYVAEFVAAPGVVAVSSGEHWIDEHDRPVDVPRRPNRRERIFREQPRYVLTQGELVRLCLRNGQVYGEPSAVMFRRAAFEAVGGYRTEMGHVADLDLDLRLAGVGPVAYLRDPLVRRRLHPGMATRDQQASGETAAARERLHRAWIDHPALSARDRARARAALASWAARDVVKSVRHGRWSVAREQARVVGRYGLNRPGVVVENAAELVTGRNRDAR